MKKIIIKHKELLEEVEETGIKREDIQKMGLFSGGIEIFMKKGKEPSSSVLSNIEQVLGKRFNIFVEDITDEEILSPHEKKKRMEKK